MATVQKAASVAIPWDGINKRFQMYQEITLTLAETVNANVIELLPLPVGVRCYGVTIQMITAGVAATSIAANIGITGGTVNGFDSAVDLMGTALIVTQSTPSDTYPAAGGFMPIVDETIDAVLAITGAVTVAPKFRIWADCEYIKELKVA